MMGARVEKPFGGIMPAEPQSIPPIFGVDPSLTGTACSAVDFTGGGRAKIVEAWSVIIPDKTAKKMALIERELMVIRGVRDVYIAACAQYGLMPISIEFPDSRNALTSFGKAGGGKGQRIVTGASQWIIIGGLMAWASEIAPGLMVLPSPKQCKAAIGAGTKKAGVEPALQNLVQNLEDVGRDFTTIKEREGIHDAIAAAFAGRIALQQSAVQRKLIVP